MAKKQEQKLEQLRREYRDHHRPVFQGLPDDILQSYVDAATDELQRRGKLAPPMLSE